MKLQNSVYIPTRDGIILSNKEAIEFIANYWNCTTNTNPPIKIRYVDETYPGMRRMI